MSDLISRQAAIDVLSLGKEILSRVLDDMDVVGTDREKYSWGIGLIESNINDIEELPSAQPEIIRCMDCKYYTLKPGPNSINCYVKHCTRSARVSTSPDDYCSYAERKENR